MVIIAAFTISAALYPQLHAIIVFFLTDHMLLFCVSSVLQVLFDCDALTELVFGCVPAADEVPVFRF